MQYIYIYVTHLLLQNNGEFNAKKTIFHIIDEIKVSRAYRYMIRAYIKLSENTFYNSLKMGLREIAMSYTFDLDQNYGLEI